MTTVYAIASAKGGVGKTTTTAALATHLAGAGEDVVAVDADIGMANLAGSLGIDVGETTIHDVLAGRADPEEAVHDGPNGMRVLPGETDLDAYAEADPAGIRDVIAAFEDADHLLVDAGAGLSHDSALPLGLADETLLVSTTGTEALRDTRKTGELAERLGGSIAGAAITRVDPDDPPADDGEIAELIGEPILGRIPEDEAVPAAVEAGEPLSTFAPTAPATRAYRSLASELTGVDVPGAGPDSLEADETREVTEDDEQGSAEDDEKKSAEADEREATEDEGGESEAEAEDDEPEAKPDSDTADDPEKGSTAHVEMTSGDLSETAGEEGETAGDEGDTESSVPGIAEAEPEGIGKSVDDEVGDNDGEEGDDEDAGETNDGGGADETNDGEEADGPEDDADETGDQEGEIESTDESEGDVDDTASERSEDVESVPFRTEAAGEGSESKPDAGTEDDGPEDAEPTKTESGAERADDTEGDEGSDATAESDESDDEGERKGFFSRLLGR